MFGDKDNFHRVSTSDLVDLPPIDYDHRRVCNEIRPGIKGPRDEVINSPPIVEENCDEQAS